MHANAHEAGTDVLSAPDDAVALPAAAVVVPPNYGERLRAAREALGLGRDEFARKARLPAAILTDLESGTWSRLGAAIFVRGYVRSYARAAALDEAAIAEMLRSLDEPAPELVAARPLPAGPRWLSRYTTRVAYALLTGLVVVPLVFLMRPANSPVVVANNLKSIDGGVELPRIPLQVAQSSLMPAGAGAPGTGTLQPTEASDAPPASSAAAPEASVASNAPRPVMASLASLPSGAVSDSSRVVLRLAEPSWIELTAVEGTRLEYALLPAGSVREYRLTGAAQLRVGNARGAALEVDGRSVDLETFSRSNVARVELDGPRRSAD
jgi:cytoskeleton protein RodZ